MRRLLLALAVPATASVAVAVAPAPLYGGPVLVEDGAIWLTSDSREE